MVDPKNFKEAACENLQNPAKGLFGNFFRIPGTDYFAVDISRIKIAIYREAEGHFINTDLYDSTNYGLDILPAGRGEFLLKQSDSLSLVSPELKERVLINGKVELLASSRNLSLISLENQGKAQSVLIDNNTGQIVKRFTIDLLGIRQLSGNIFAFLEDENQVIYRSGDRFVSLDLATEVSTVLISFADLLKQKDRDPSKLRSFNVSPGGKYLLIVYENQGFIINREKWVIERIVSPLIKNDGRVPTNDQMIMDRGRVIYQRVYDDYASWHIFCDSKRTK